jgi:hypothetical protein
MIYDLISIQESYFPQLARHVPGATVLDMRYEPETERVELLQATLCRILEKTSSDKDVWLFSTFAPLLERRNLTVMRFLGDQETEVRLAAC